MRDLYLRFENEDEAKNLLIEFGFNVSEEQGGLYHPDISLDLIGIITHSSGDEDLIEITTEEGYHVNLRVMDDEIDLSSFEDFIIRPKTPVRIWA